MSRRKQRKSQHHDSDRGISRKGKWVLGGAALLVLAGAGIAAHLGNLSIPGSPKIAEGSEAIFNDETALAEYIKAYGPKKTTRQLHDLSSKFGSCHNPAHLAGRFAYEQYGEKAFKECSAECHSGCYHGATEAFFKEKGTANLTENINTICSSELNSFFTHQCVHGIGHGLAAWASYDLPSALQSCDQLDRMKDSCYTGVFMENIVGGLAAGEEETEYNSGHFTQYLSDDPHYPCNVVEDQYKGSCYFLQTSRMMQLFKADFRKIAETCGQAPEAYRRLCYESMGRDVGGYYQKDAVSSIRACGYAPAGSPREGCIVGAVQDSFWDATGKGAAAAFCRLVDQNEKDACYQMIISRAPDVLDSARDRQAFCATLENPYRESCAAALRK